MRIIVTKGNEEERVPNPDSPSYKCKEPKNEISPKLEHRKKKKKKKNGIENGNNSEDECTGNKINPLNREQILNMIKKEDEDFKQFLEELQKKKGFTIKKMGADGNCLFRSVADQVFGDQEMHDQVRERVMDYISAERDHFSQFITEDFDQYVARKRRDRTYGNNTEIQAVGELYNRPIEIYTFNRDGLQVINLFHGQYSTDNAPIRLSYHHGNHYNSVVDPNSPSVGVGLGLPDFQPGVSIRTIV